MSKKIRIVMPKPGQPATHTAVKRNGKVVLVPFAYSDRAKLNLQNSHKKAQQRKRAAGLLRKSNVRAFEGKEWEAFVALWDGDEAAARRWLEANPEARNRAAGHSARASSQLPQNIRY